MDKLKNWMQNAFNIAYTNLLAQGRISTTNDIGCAYRGANGAKCALGWLIPDDKYYEDMEQLSAAYFFNHPACPISHDVLDAIGLPKYLSKSKLDRARKFLERIQAAHDQHEIPRMEMDDTVWLAGFKSAAEEIAESFGLTVPDEPAPV